MFRSLKRKRENLSQTNPGVGLDISSAADLVGVGRGLEFLWDRSAIEWLCAKAGSSCHRPRPAGQRCSQPPVKAEWGKRPVDHCLRLPRPPSHVKWMNSLVLTWRQLSWRRISRAEQKREEGDKDGAILMTENGRRLDRFLMPTGAQEVEDVPDRRAGGLRDELGGRGGLGLTVNDKETNAGVDLAIVGNWTILREALTTVKEDRWFRNVLARPCGARASGSRWTREDGAIEQRESGERAVTMGKFKQSSGFTWKHKQFCKIFSCVRLTARVPRLWLLTFILRTDLALEKKEQILTTAGTSKCTLESVESSNAKKFFIFSWTF